MSRKKSTRGSVITKKIRSKNGKEYKYWVAKVTVGKKPDGKQKQVEIVCKSHAEANKVLTDTLSKIDAGTYCEPTKMTVGQWLDEWVDTFLINLKPGTVSNYKSNIKNHLMPTFGKVRLDKLDGMQIQSFYKSCMGKVSNKSLKNIHGILHHALSKAVELGYISKNPADSCELPRVIQKQLYTFDESEIRQFCRLIKGSQHELFYFTAIFTGMRRGELMGLQWKNVDLESGLITVSQQLQKNREKKAYELISPKNGKMRLIKAPQQVVVALRLHKAAQERAKEAMGDKWSDEGFVFTTKRSGHYFESTGIGEFKKIVAELGRPEFRFHDLRHTYATMSLENGDSIKALQENLGHATAAFTLERYGHLTHSARQKSSESMAQLIERVAR